MTALTQNTPPERHAPLLSLNAFFAPWSSALPSQSRGIPEDEQGDECFGQKTVSVRPHPVPFRVSMGHPPVIL